MTLKTLPAPKQSHAAELRPELSQRHAGQIVTPVVRAWRKGTAKFLVQLSWYDAGDQTYSDPEEFVGDFWGCTRWLAANGCHADITA